MLIRKYLSSIKGFSFILLFILWELLSNFSNPATFPSLLSIGKTLFAEVLDGELIFHLVMTLYRVFVSFFIAMIVGILIGMLMGNYKNFDSFFDGWNILFLNIPALVLIILSYIWFGLTEAAAIVAVSLNKIPNVVVTIREGAKSIDKSLLEVAFVELRWLHQRCFARCSPALPSQRLPTTATTPRARRRRDNRARRCYATYGCCWPAVARTCGASRRRNSTTRRPRPQPFTSS